MSLPNEPDQPTATDPTITPTDIPAAVPSYTASETPAPMEATATAVGPPTGTGTADEAAESEHGAGGKIKAAALAAGAAALAKKVRQEAPKKVQDLRQKRAAGRCVILIEHEGLLRAIGPYADSDSARQDTTKLAGAPRIVELTPKDVYFSA